MSCNAYIFSFRLQRSMQLSSIINRYLQTKVHLVKIIDSVGLLFGSVWGTASCIAEVTGFAFFSTSIWMPSLISLAV